ncbi:MAG: hypothetical protein J0L93_02640 [Deltaproteobacteria bacterium]|nr:hypothetical protein [Deltaproteobacteria bacterium]
MILKEEKKIEQKESMNCENKITAANNAKRKNNFYFDKILRDNLRAMILNKKILKIFKSYSVDLRKFKLFKISANTPHHEVLAQALN